VQRDPILEWREPYARCNLTVGFEPLPGATFSASVKPIFPELHTALKDQDGYNKEFLPKVLPMIKEGGGEYVAGGFNKTHSLSGAAPYSV
jgi:hypothetical protein